MHNYVVNVTNFCPNCLQINVQMSSIYSASYDLSHERKHSFDLNQMLWFIKHILSKVMITYTWINAKVH